MGKKTVVSEESTKSANCAHGGQKKSNLKIPDMAKLKHSKRHVSLHCSPEDNPLEYKLWLQKVPGRALMSPSAAAPAYRNLDSKL